MLMLVQWAEFNKVTLGLPCCSCATQQWNKQRHKRKREGCLDVIIRLLSPLRCSLPVAVPQRWLQTLGARPGWGLWKHSLQLLSCGTLGRCLIWLRLLGKHISQHQRCAVRPQGEYHSVHAALEGGCLDCMLSLLNLEVKSFSFRIPVRPFPLEDWSLNVISWLQRLSAKHEIALLFILDVLIVTRMWLLRPTRFSS